MCSAYRFIFLQIKLIFRTKTRFETEVQGNPEMAYYIAGGL